MTKKRFTYSGPAQTIPMRVPAGDGTAIEEVSFMPDATVELDEAHGVTRALDAAGYLAEAPAEPIPERGGRRLPAPAPTEEPAP